MKKNEITIGGVYRAKVSDKLTDVRIDQECPAGGWNATNLATGKTIRIKSAQRLRAPSDTKAVSAKNATSGDAKKKAPKDAKPAGKRDTAKRGGPTANTGAKAGAKTAANGKAKATSGGKRTSGLDSAAQVLAKAKEPMSCKEIVDLAIEQKLWSPGGKTPHATIYSAIIREIANKGSESRFRKADRGKFELANAKKKGA